MQACNQLSFKINTAEPRNRSIVTRSFSSWEKCGLGTRLLHTWSCILRKGGVTMHSTVYLPWSKAISLFVSVCGSASHWLFGESDHPGSCLSTYSNRTAFLCLTDGNKFHILLKKYFTVGTVILAHLFHSPQLVNSARISGNVLYHHGQ